MKTFLTLPLVALMSAALLTACGNDEVAHKSYSDKPSAGPSVRPTETPKSASEKPEPSASPIPAEEEYERISTELFTASAPAAWENITFEARESYEPVVTAFRAPAKPGETFRTNLNVVKIPLAREYTAEEMRTIVEAEIASMGAKLVAGPKKTEVAGLPAVFYKSKLKELSIHQLQVVKDDASIVVTVTSAADAEATEVLELLTSTWAWR